MDDQLLIIDTRIPARMQGLITRPRLVQDIEQGLGEARMVLLAAPAGYGKTALLTEWAHATDRPVAWLTLEAEQNNAHQLLRYLAAAWSVVDPSLLDSAVGLLLETFDADVDLMARTMANYALLSATSLVFVLDDLHLIQTPAAAGMLMFLIDHFPADVRFVAACRSDISLPRSRLRVRHHMKEIGPDRLAFRLEETIRLFEQAHRPALSESEIAFVQERCGGWIAGLQLLAQSDTARTGDLAGMLGAQGAIARYFVEEVLGALDEESRRFLLQVCVLEQLCPELCDAVTGTRTSQTTLDALERANFFLQPMDAGRTWYRLHPLLVEALRHQLRAPLPQDEPILHGRAARWLLAQGMIDEAFRHAVAGGDRDLAVQIVESYVVMKLESGEYRAIQGWLEIVPEAWYGERPELSILPMVFSVFSGDVDGALRLIDQLDARLATAQDRASERLRAKLAVGRCAIACFMDEVPKAEAYAATALRDLDAGDVTFRANTHHALADTYRRHGRWSEARSQYLQVLEFGNDPAVFRRSAHVYGALADLELRQGHLRAAESYWQKDIATIRGQENWGKLPAPVIGWAFIRHGELLYEWNRLDEARSELERGMERAELGGDSRAMIAGYLLASRLRLAAADLDGATGYLEQAATLVERARYPEWLSRVDRLQALLFSHRNDAAAALDWCRHIGFGDALRERPDNQESFLGLAQLLIQFGGDLERRRVRAMLADQRMQAETEGRRGIQVETLALEAIERQSAGYESEALIAFDQALRMAETERPVRLLIDLGPPVRRLLERAGQRGALSEYGSLLLAASARTPMLSGGQMVEPLSERELEILRLVAAGLTNREVGDRLYISDETVKKHLANIYGKLQVHRRIEAAVRARELGLLR